MRSSLLIIVNESPKVEENWAQGDVHVRIQVTEGKDKDKIENKGLES